MWTLITIAAGVMLLALVVRFVQPEFLYSVRRAAVAVSSRKAFLRYDAQIDDSPNSSLADGLMGSLRYEMRFCDPDYAIERVRKLRELYRALDPRREAPSGLGRRQRPQGCIVELAGLIRSLGFQIEVSDEASSPVIGSSAVLRHLAGEINRAEGLNPVNVDGLDQWLRENPMSIEQIVELVSASVIALAYRLQLQEEAGSEKAVHDSESQISVWISIQRTERVLRSLVRREYQRHESSDIAVAFERVLGHDEYTRCLSVMKKNRREIVGMEADVVDFLTINQLRELLVAKWDLFEEVLGKESTFQEEIQRIIEGRDRLAAGRNLETGEVVSLKSDCAEISRRALRYRETIG